MVYRISQPSVWLSEARRAFALGVIREAVVQWQQHGDETKKRVIHYLFARYIVIMVLIVIYIYIHMVASNLAS